MGASTNYSSARKEALLNRDNMFQQQHRQLLELLQEHNIKVEPISQMTATEMVQALNRNQLTSLQIVVALGLKCCSVGRELGLITSLNICEAIEMAKNCDKIRQETGLRNWTISDGEQNDETKFLPPLFGIPISLKDTFDWKGHPSTVGLSSRTQPVEKSSPLTECLIQGGAIPFVKSNVPQYCFSAETNNLLWGRSRNPWNNSRAVGGSSGGEAGLIAAGCSVIGVGSDIGGSIRIPALHCGLFALKPSSGRISGKYHTELSRIVTGISNTIPLCIGPLSKSTTDLMLFLKMATTQKFYKNNEDPYTKIFPFNVRKYEQTKEHILSQKKGENRKIKIGVIRQLADIQVCPTAKRAVNEVIDVLASLGCQIQEVVLPNQREIIRDYLLVLNGSRGHYIKDQLKGEQPTPENQEVIKIQSLGGISLSIASLMTRMFLPRIYFYSFQKQLKSVLDYQKLIGDIQGQKQQFMKYFKEKEMDYIICPGFPVPAIKHGRSNKMGLILAYTYVWNLLDVPVGAVPVTLIQDHEQVFDSHYNDMFIKEVQNNMRDSMGLPVGIQIIGKPYKQEEVLGLMKILEDKINFYDKHPLPKHRVQDP